MRRNPWQIPSPVGQWAVAAVPGATGGLPASAAGAGHWRAGRQWHPARDALTVALLLLGTLAEAAAPEALSVDFEGYRPDCGVVVRQDGDSIEVLWPIGEEAGRLVLDLRPDAPRVRVLGLGAGTPGGAVDILKGVDPVTFVTVGTRVGESGRPPSMSPFNAFFDAPARRPHQTYKAELDLKRVRVLSQGRRLTITLADLTAGPFSGELHFTVYAGANLIFVEAVATNKEESRAYLYDVGLVADRPNWDRVAWTDTGGRPQSAGPEPDAADLALAVRHRAIAAQADGGSVACFPPPHEFFFARDLTDNLKTAWYGRRHRKLEARCGFGIRQSEGGGGNFAPWYNAPPGTEQRMGVFYLLARGSAADALREALKYTHGDRFPDLPGHRTFTSHWHMATAVAAMDEQASGKARPEPDWVGIFKGMNVNIVHLAEFHGDGHPQDPGPLRLPELAAMFAECRRRSDADLLLLPGEEANVHLRAGTPGVNPGHWLYLFPKPVAWTMTRAPGQPFAEDDPRFGTVYHVGNQGDMVRLLETEHGLAWTAHPRSKASTWAPDVYRDQAFFRSPIWLGAAWKGMPVDLSRERLGERALDLLDDMANWGARRYMPGEVDVFKVDRTHELYGHMNINYLRLDPQPRFDDGWKPVLDALRGGRFFVTTGEVLIRDFTVGGKGSGETLRLGADARPPLRAEFDWTFPPLSVDVISGDGHRVYRERTILADLGAFARTTLTLSPDLRDRTWVRVEAWDVAGNGAFTQPVWLEAVPGATTP